MSERLWTALIVVLVASVIGVSVQLVHKQLNSDLKRTSHELCEENQKLRAALLVTVPADTAAVIERDVPAREC